MSAHPGKAILIAGPTASGKSALAVALARDIGGVVVNADSMQVYRDLHILTARPSENELAQAPHALYGHVDGAQSYSVGRYVADAAAALDRSRQQGLVPIFVGGTGLYFMALTEGLSPVPEIAPALRDRWRAAAAEHGAAALHRQLAERDPVMAHRLSSTDTQRIVRALEVIEATGLSLAHWQSLKGTPPLAGWETIGFVLRWPRETLYERADARFEAMINAGALDEIRQLQARADVPADAMVRRALGVTPLTRHLDGQLDLPTAIEAGRSDTRKYIKRQLTWLGSRMIAWNSVQMTDNCETTVELMQSAKRIIDAAPSRA